MAQMTGDILQLSRLSHYQFSWTARGGGGPGLWTLRLVLDEGAREEVLTISADDAGHLQEALARTKNVCYDVERRILMFGVTQTGD